MAVVAGSPIKERKPKMSKEQMEKAAKYIKRVEDKPEQFAGAVAMLSIMGFDIVASETGWDIIAK